MHFSNSSKESSGIGTMPASPLPRFKWNEMSIRNHFRQ
jgi:hypothetical protein